DPVAAAVRRRNSTRRRNPPANELGPSLLPLLPGRRGPGGGWFVAFVLRIAIGGSLPYAAWMNAFPVNLEKQTQLEHRMAALGVREPDIEETFVRSGGHGGQNVNKTSTCVMLLHRPTRVQVKCQATRQQGLNRFLARKLLLDKIEALQKSALAAERARLEKIRRQKRKRSRGARERMLADKSHHAAKKEFR